MADSLRLLKTCFDESLATVYEHPKGHALPCRAPDVEAVIGFLLNLPSAAAASAATPRAEEKKVAATTPSPPPPPQPPNPTAPSSSSSTPIQLTAEERTAQLAAWAEELMALEAMYSDVLAHDEGCVDAARLSELAEADENSSDHEKVEVSFSVLLDGGGGGIDISDAAGEGSSPMPPGEVRLQMTLKTATP